MNNPQTTKFAKLIERQRLHPRIWDYSYFLLRNNLNAFTTFRDLVAAEKKTRILDIGCGFKPWLELFDKTQVEYIGVDFDQERSSADFLAYADKLPFPDNQFDALIYSEVLEHAQNLPVVLKEMHRVAKPDALVFLSSPFVFPEHGVPFDFQRLSRYYYENIFRDDEILELRESNTSVSTAIVSINLALEVTPFGALCGFKNLLYAFTNSVGLICDKLLQWFLLPLRKEFRDQVHLMPLGYALIVRIKK
ncbi:MAG: class I SAM-dependent methyltransferase [Nitrospirae bacterium]|nr:class I SAM-dependent methyltransferase [Nitrospirota bacterium]